MSRCSLRAVTRWILLAVFAALVGGAPVALAGPESEAATDAPESSSGPPEAPPGSARYGGDRPAEGEPYQWRQMALAGGIILLMIAFLVWLIRRQKRS